MTPPVTLGADTGPLAWQKSSFSSGDPNTNCLEVAVCADHLYLRESDTPSITISPEPSAFRTLLAHLKAASTI